MRERRWVALIELIDGLPSASRLNEAKAADPELAASYLAYENSLSDEERQREGTWAPPVSEFGTEGAMLATLIDEIKAMRADLVSVMGGKPGEFKPFPRPITELQRQREREEEQAAVELFMAFGFSEEDLL